MTIEPAGDFDQARHVAEAVDTGAEVAFLDLSGTIVWVNDAWKAFAGENGGDPGRAGIGTSYLDVCAGVADESTREVATAIRSALAGDIVAPIAVEVPCHAPTVSRWYDALISSRFDSSGRCVGATVTYSLAWSQPMAESALGVKVDHLRFGWQDAPMELTQLRDRLDTMQRLHDEVIDEVFATGMTLQALAVQVDSPEQAEKINRSLDDLDRIIQLIRGTLFDLGSTDHTSSSA